MSRTSCIKSCSHLIACSSERSIGDVYTSLRSLQPRCSVLCSLMVCKKRFTAISLLRRCSMLSSGPIFSPSRNILFCLAVADWYMMLWLFVQLLCNSSMSCALCMLYIGHLVNRFVSVSGSFMLQCRHCIFSSVAFLSRVLFPRSRHAPALAVIMSPIWSFVPFSVCHAGYPTAWSAKMS